MLFCVKYIVILYNFFFWLIGIGILGSSLFLYVDSKAYVNFEATAELFETPFFVLMVIGAVMTFVGFLGCCGALKESPCLLGAYVFFCVTIGFACTGAVWWAIRNEQTVRIRIKSEFRRQIKEKYGNREHQKVGATEFIIDKIQRDFACCGDKGIFDWHNSLFNDKEHGPGRNRTRPFHIESGISGNEHYQVPASCCKLSLARSECEQQRKFVLRLGENAVGLNREGCVSKMETFVEEKWKYFVLLATGLVAVQVFALIFSCCFCCAIGRVDDK